MEGITTLITAKKIMGINMVGPFELKKINQNINFFNLDVLTNEYAKIVPFSENILFKLRKTHLLILIIPDHKSKSKLSFAHFRKEFGIDPIIKEPCFYNQDWYLKENFYLDSTLELKWVMIQKEIAKESRGVIPSKLNVTSLHKSLVYTYIFFMYYLSTQNVLWENEYIWCSDLDSNDDQIYIGRYLDPQRINKNGFSIHRHLKVNNNYGVLNIL